MTALAQRLGVDNDTFDHACAIAFKVCERTFSYQWAAAGLAGGTLDRGEMWADLVSEVLMWVSEGEDIPDAFTLALKAWGAEQFQVADVTQKRTDDGGMTAYVARVPSENPEDVPGDDPSLEAATDRIDAMRVLQKVRAALTDEEWELMVQYADAGSYYALGKVLGMTSNGVRHRVRKVQARVADLGLASLVE
jgi:hypothetical protein